MKFYVDYKFGSGKSLKLNKLMHPFFMRKNPFDYATFEEVLLREEYKIDLNYKPSTIIDAGGNIGLTSVFFSNIYPDSQIISIEPDRENYTILKANTKNYKNITTKNCGLWSHETYLNVIDNGLGNNSFTVEETIDNQPGSIHAVSVQSIMKENNWKQIDLLKIDIEGSEKIIFENNYNNWLPHIKTIIIELHDRMQPGASRSVFKAISNYNFSCEIKGENLIFRSTDLT